MIHHISHNDLDGVGCQIVSHYLCDDWISFYNANYDNVDDTIIRVVESLGKDDSILITDLSPVSNHVITMLDELNSESNKVTLVDHHKTAKEKLDEYDWAYIDLNNSATLNLYLYLEDLNNKGNPDLLEFARVVNDWDLWIHEDPRSTRLNTLFGILGLQKFRSRFLTYLDVSENESERIIVNTMLSIRDDYVKKAVNRASILIDDDGTPYAYVYAEKHPGEIAGTILDENKLIKYVLIRNAQNETVSLRSRNGEYDVSVLAKLRGGGGHPAASGYPLKNSHRV